MSNIIVTKIGVDELHEALPAGDTYVLQKRRAAFKLNEVAHGDSTTTQKGYVFPELFSRKAAEKFQELSAFRWSDACEPSTQARCCTCRRKQTSLVLPMRQNWVWATGMWFRRRLKIAVQRCTHSRSVGDEEANIGDYYWWR